MRIHYQSILAVSALALVACQPAQPKTPDLKYVGDVVCIVNGETVTHENASLWTFGDYFSRVTDAKGDVAKYSAAVPCYKQYSGI